VGINKNSFVSTSFQEVLGSNLIIVKFKCILYPHFSPLPFQAKFKVGRHSTWCKGHARGSVKWSISL